MATGLSGYPVRGTCNKCATELSTLFEYRPGYWICRSNGCWDEEEERDSKRHVEQQADVEEYKKLVAGTNV